MKTNDIRQAFLDYFKSKSHEIIKSSSLIPAGDPTLLFVNAGMVQFKDCFLGSDKRAYCRATTSQKCLRISGKHNDLENVGRTARHHTFFEMLGNFSFGDYFKEDAIKFAWEFLTVVLSIPKNRLWVTIFEDDNEAETLWKEHTDVLNGRILRCGAKDNFWAMGDTGPCGPCSEIHYYLGDDESIQSEEDFRKEDGRYIEIWNLVFMQFNRDVSGALNPLPKPSVDTGMGLERIAAVKQGVRSNYDIESMRCILEHTERLCKKPYDGSDYTERDTLSDEQYAIDVAHRVIVDHVRASAFLIADGVLPSSDGRGYVLRRLIRRACRHGRVLGFHSAFLYQVVTTVIESMSGVYSELAREAENIVRVLRKEEEKFIETLGSGMKVLEREVVQMKDKSSLLFAGDVAFSLHDTYGFPLDLTEDILRARGISVDMEGFSQAMEAQRVRSRSARASEKGLVLRRAVGAIKTTFKGYEFLEYESDVVGLFDENGEMACASVGQEIALVTSETPFYAESGGQVGDIGSISSNGATLEVLDTQKAAGDTTVHVCRVLEGSINKGDRVRLSVDVRCRQKIQAHHSATHLIHKALRKVLGGHVKQAGSRVSPQSLRFDFSHFAPVDSGELQKVEFLVNEYVRLNVPVVIEYMGLEEAKSRGVIALFDEKYGETVRVVRMGELSAELCGGTHVTRSGDIGYVSLVVETSISSGVRRIEAVAGDEAAHAIAKYKQVLRELSDLLNIPQEQLIERVQKLSERTKDLERQVQRLGSAANVGKTGNILERAVLLSDGTNVIASILEDASPKQLREVADDIRSRMPRVCVALGSVIDGKAIMLTAVSDDLVGKYHAGDLMKKLANVLGCRGGGRADLAQAGGGDAVKLKSAIEQFQEFLS